LLDNIFYNYKINCVQISLTSILKQIMNFMPLIIYLKLKKFIFFFFNYKKYKSYQHSRKKINSEFYSLQPFDRSKSIFIHIPKCAGVSITKHFYKNYAGGHKTLKDYSLIFSSNEILNYYKFSVVRNPWDRLVSSYHFLSGGGFNKEDAIWSKKNLAKYDDFNHFVKRWVCKSNLFRYIHFYPQYYFISSSHIKLKINYLMFFENLAEDIKIISKKLKIQSKLLHINKSSHKNYKNYYDEESKSIVSSVYSEDIKLFGYDFDNSSLQAQIKKRNNFELPYQYNDF